MRYRIDSMSLRDGVMMIEGWCIPYRTDKIEYSVTDMTGKPMKCTVVARDRADVATQFRADRMSGFTAAIPFERDEDAYLVMRDGNEVRRVRFNNKIVEKRNSIKAKRMEKLIALVHIETLVVSFDFIRENGLKAFMKKAVHKIQKIDEDYDYSEWQFKTAMPEAEIERQKEEWKKFEFESGKAPLISIVIPAYNTDPKYLRMLFDSIKAQTYPVLEVILADGSDAAGKGEAAAITKEYAATDPRFKLIELGGNRGISGNTNAGLLAASGDFIALCDHDDELPPWALFEAAKAIAENPRAEFIYTDEDKIDFDGKALFEPHFKPDMNMELLCSVNYICHLSLIRKDLLEKVGGFREEFDGAQDHDFFFRCLEEAVREETVLLDEAYENGMDQVRGRLRDDSIEKLKEGRFVSERVIHIPKICYHWRCHKGSTAADPKAKLYAFEAGSRAVKAHYDRMGIAYEEVEKGVTYGYYHTVYKKPDPTDYCISVNGSGESKVIEKHMDAANGAVSADRGSLPLISVIIPNKDHIEDLDKCIRSVIDHSEYRNLEFIVVENNSDRPETFAYYELIDNCCAADKTAAFDAALARGINIEAPDAEMEKIRLSYKPLETDIPVRVVYWEDKFNYSEINNFGVGFARGSMLLFLNNDVELIAGDAVTSMVNIAMRERVGIVGARLMYGDDTIQHAGVIVGLGGIAGAAFVGLHEKENSYMHRMMCTQALSAVTAACLMMRKEVFEKAGGFRKELAVAFNDIDLCMKVRALGKLVIYDPYAAFHHYESKSRGLEDTPEKVERFNNEIAIFASKWGGILEHGDPYYNTNLTLRKSNFALRDLTKEKPGEPYKLELDVEKQLKTVLREKERRGL